ncbi:MAG: UDP-N-acetylglucosamine--N-acetylmuramyl-(pentapeptide) pyrophosphoryl-undecaprenol N-acetylglucosamine transferase [Bacteroidales bacterium]|nr:UDP-N-acetylglucosamine--N-acetylmuramyl-(pentapeptide) pyrophosphoryl-undecaprenol N-acetylglucosamine transferase [Bacteroidales bacterium]
MKKYKKIRAIISGGGTGGHIFPAVSIASKLRELNPENEILFVGAEGKMEMEKVPAAGFEIVGLPILGLQRQLNWKNIKNDIQVPFRWLASLHKAGRVIDSFKPDIAIGVGGYASAPLLRKAVSKGIPTLIQEQNGFAGLTNRMLSKKVGCICVAYEGMEKFFPADKIVFSGNPIRPEMHPYSAKDREEALAFYGLDPAKKHLLIVGGSLGSGTLNAAMKKWISDGCPGGEGVQVLWQCGKYYKKGVDEFMAGRDLPDIRHSDFIARMDYAYAAADLIISRSGASSISEICATRKAAVFVPSPNVAEDHQTHNAMALVSKDAAVLVRDAEASGKLMPVAMELIRDRKRLAEMERNTEPLARLDAAQTIVDEIYKLV